MKIIEKALFSCFWLLFLCPPAQPADSQSGREMDTEKSVLTIRVYKAGLFSTFAHDHEIRAFIHQGSFDEVRRTVQFVVMAGSLRVLDPGVSDKDRSDIQGTMLGPKVLDSEKFPEVQFRSTRIEQAGNGKWTAEGELTLHGQSHPVKAVVEGREGRYHGSAQLRQKDFGITPISLAGGSVKVKDEVRIEFEVVSK
jgi:hypothetical protein